MGRRDIVTIITKKQTVTLNKYASESARTYVEMLVDACRRRKIDARAALIDTDDYPQLARATMVEYGIGWLHGCAEAHGVKVEELFDAIAMPEIEREVDKLKESWGINGKKKPQRRKAA